MLVFSRHGSNTNFMLLQLVCNQTVINDLKILSLTSFDQVSRKWYSFSTICFNAIMPLFCKLFDKLGV